VLKAIEDGILDESEITDRTPAGRIAEPSDIAGAVVMLCTPGAGFVTGQSLTVDGGYTMFGAAHKATKIPGRAVDA
jgi:NAD(P)-dependent dehydrogenase (short-subunit alcohol dehydrogenase family)